MPNLYRLKRKRSGLQDLTAWLVVTGGVAAGCIIGAFVIWPRESNVPASLTEELPAQPLIASGTRIPTNPEGEFNSLPTNDDSQNAIPTPRLAPDFSLPDLDGQIHRLSEHDGQVVLLNFWTTWCIPCREEMPALQAVFDEYHEQGFTVLGVNLYELDSRAEIESFVGELGITFPILLDVESGVHRQLYRVIGIPTSVFIDRTGLIEGIIVGAIPIDELEPRVRELLNR